jgi:glycosyltransferase involved in cell wall biosynthesis
MSDPVRIAHVALQLETGGMERLLTEFARHADRRRFEPRFVSLGSRGPAADDIESAGCPVTALNGGPGIRPTLMFRLARLFRDQGIDIVHAHNTKPLLYAGPAARLAHVGGVVYTRHGQRQGATRRQDLLFRLAARCADRVVCVSEDATRLCRRDGVDAGAVRSIWNGIDRDRFGFSGPVADAPAVFVGRLSPEKDVETLLRAAAIAVERRPSFRLRIAGAGPCAGGLSALADTLGLRGHVEFLGEVRDVPALLRGASLFVLSSVTEGLPLTVLEAMACGLPVVSTRVGGTPEAVVQGVSGLLVNPRDPGQLAHAMLQIHSDADLARRMGLAGRARVEEHFDVRTMVSRYESLYLDVLCKSRSLAA